MTPRLSRAHALRRRIVQRLAFLAVLVGILWLVAERDTQARRAPYYVLQTKGEAEVRPRVLFAVDTSGSMSWRAAEGMSQCAWTGCETPGSAQESRISVARRVIQQVVQSTQERASFALMTFDQNDAPTTTPPRCGSNRFTWVTWYGYFEWAPLQAYPGVQGAWHLCQSEIQQPYPYLRWDNLGVGSKIFSNNQTGAVPASPLIGTGPSQIQDNRNAQRKVQWFPRFMGVRAQLNATTDPGGNIMRATVGDYGTTDLARSTNVWNHDFYYWPYVDGFPHYSDTTVWPSSNGVDRGGIGSENGAIAEAKLYAPFYLNLEGSSVPSSLWGPADADAATAEVLAKTSPLVSGGIDVAGATPWASVIGQIPNTPPQSNVAGAHKSVASYLKFVTSQNTSDSCAPTTLVMLTDGIPSEGEGGSVLYQRLAALRRDLGVRTYAVGFFTGGESQINDMACAAAGACDGFSCNTPCDDQPSGGWDTCANPDDPKRGCAYLADSAEELAAVLLKIVQASLGVELPSGPGFTSNDYFTRTDSSTGQDDRAVSQTTMNAHTEYPGWKGHLVRSYCTHVDENGALLPMCVPPSPEFESAELEETFGPCPQSRVWDAGECLALTPWASRRIYSAKLDGTVYRISDDSGNASAVFVDELKTMGIVGGSDATTRANAIAAFILGKDWPGGWKLPGLANSAPVLVHRIPRHDDKAVPSVNIRDPHCGGRAMPTDADVPASLTAFARNAWSPDVGVINAPSKHYEYQEAVLLGDDLGVLHAFQYNSGNELWGFMPREAFSSAVAQAAIGPAGRGQPDKIAEHRYGIASTLNAGWVYDDRSNRVSDHRWRHLGVFGMGVGGRHYYALDLSHMSPRSPRGPVEVLWSTSSVSAAFHDRWLGETWARPALTYHVPSESISQEPDAFLVMGSGYAVNGTDQGRALMIVDALTGNVDRWAQVEAPAAGQTIDYPSNYGVAVDPAVASHCLSGFWAEAQEAYIADSAGRLYRWDVGRTSGHASDSGGVWANGGQATPAASFPACRGPSSGCTVSAGGPGDPFAFAPAVTANNRIDDASGIREDVDQYLVALISGSADDLAIDGRVGSNFHSSIYLLVDDHQGAARRHQGFSIPTGAPKLALSDIGSNPSYMRVALSDLTRTRRFRPFPTASTIEETRRFSAATRPIASPQIQVYGVVEDQGGVATPVDGNEVYVITYTVYEPPTQACDPRFYDKQTGTWYTDQGDTFAVTFRLTANSGSGFNFKTGSSDTDVDFGDGFARGLSYMGTVQLEQSGCVDGNCGAGSRKSPNLACESQGESTSIGTPTSAVMSNRFIHGFSPLE